MIKHRNVRISHAASDKEKDGARCSAPPREACSHASKKPTLEPVSRARTPGRRSHGLGQPVHARPFHADFVEDAYAKAARRESAAHYTAPIGSPELKAEIRKKLRRQNGLDVDPERNILITPGSDSGLFFAILPFIQPGDEVIIPSPSYPNNFLDVRIAGGVPVAVELKAENGYQLDPGSTPKRYTKPRWCSSRTPITHHHGLQPRLARGSLQNHYRQRPRARVRSGV